MATISLNNSFSVHKMFFFVLYIWLHAHVIIYYFHVCALVFAALQLRCAFDTPLLSHYIRVDICLKCISQGQKILGLLQNGINWHELGTVTIDANSLRRSQVGILESELLFVGAVIKDIWDFIFGRKPRSCWSVGMCSRSNRLIAFVVLAAITTRRVLFTGCTRQSTFKTNIPFILVKTWLELRTQSSLRSTHGR